MASFLQKHYLCDESFSLEYSLEILKSQMSFPLSTRLHPSWHVVLREKETQNMVGFVTARKTRVQFSKHLEEGDSKKEEGDRESAVAPPSLPHSHTLPCAFVNFLCVHHSYRGRGIAPLLIREVTRRISFDPSVNIALHTSGTRLPGCLSTSPVYLLPLSPSPSPSSLPSSSPPTTPSPQKSLIFDEFFPSPSLPSEEEVLREIAKDLGLVGTVSVVPLTGDKLLQRAYDMYVERVVSNSEIELCLVPNKEEFGMYLLSLPLPLSLSLSFFLPPLLSLSLFSPMTLSL